LTRSDIVYTEEHDKIKQVKISDLNSIKAKELNLLCESQLMEDESNAAEEDDTD